MRACVRTRVEETIIGLVSGAYIENRIFYYKALFVASNWGATDATIKKAIHAVAIHFKLHPNYSIPWRKKECML